MSNLDYKIISISGNARCGKDTMGQNFSSVLKDLGIKSKVVSFAYELKKSVDEFLKSQTGISAFTDNDDEKRLIRPFLVCWGTDIMRGINDNIWIERLTESLSDSCVNIITDLRFTNELNWVKDNKGFSIMLERDGIGPANEYERINNNKLAELVDLNFCIGSFDDQRLLKLTSLEILDKIINEETYESWKATCPL